MHCMFPMVIFSNVGVRLTDGYEGIEMFENEPTISIEDVEGRNLFGDMVETVKLEEGIKICEVSKRMDDGVEFEVEIKTDVS